MKKRILYTFILVGLMACGIAHGYQAKIFNALTGGGASALDAVSVSSLSDGAVGFVLESSTSRYYTMLYVAASVNAEQVAAHPFTVRPDDYTTSGVWHEPTIGFFVDGLSGGSIYVPHANFGTVNAGAVTSPDVSATELGVNTTDTSGASIFVKAVNATSGATPLAVGDGTGKNIFVVKGDGDIGIMKPQMYIGGVSDPLYAFNVTGGKTNLYGGLRVAGGNFWFQQSTEYFQVYSCFAFIFNAVYADSDFILYSDNRNDTFYMDAANDNIGIRNSTPDSDYALDVNGGVSVTALRMGSAVPVTGITSFLTMPSGVSPAGSMTTGVMYYSVNGEAWVNDSNGTHTQLSSLTLDSGEPYINKYNVYTGKGIKVNLETGVKTYYTVPRISPVTVHREEWLSEYIHRAEIGESPESAFITVDDPIEGLISEPVKRYSVGKDGVGETTVIRKTVIFTSIGKTRKILKPGHRLDVNTGKIWRKPSLLEAEAAALSGFSESDVWAKMPKFVRDDWSK